LYYTVTITTCRQGIETVGVWQCNNATTFDSSVYVADTKIAFDIPAIAEISSEIDTCIGCLGIFLNI